VGRSRTEDVIITLCKITDGNDSKCQSASDQEGEKMNGMNFIVVKLSICVKLLTINKYIVNLSLHVYNVYSHAHLPKEHRDVLIQNTPDISVRPTFYFKIASK